MGVFHLATMDAVEHLVTNRSVLSKLVNSFNTAYSSATHPFSNRNDYISSSTLGITDPSQLYGRLTDPNMADPMDPNQRALTYQGTKTHEYMQSALERAGLLMGKEMYIEDPNNKVFGYIDAMYSNGIPLEIKTTTSSALKYLDAPKEEHVSQTNFYALASQASYAEIMYVARDAPSMTKSFTVYPDLARYQADVHRLRQFQKIHAIPFAESNKITGFRPASSWLGAGVNYDMPLLSKVPDQNKRLSRMPWYNKSSTTAGHPNDSSRMEE